MNLKDINSVAELVFENERTLSPEERASQALAKCDVTFHLKICKVLVVALREYHVQQANELMSEGETDTSLAWAVDATNLNNALQLLEQVEF